MRISRGVRPQKKLWTWVCVALLFLLVACGANTNQENKHSVFQIPAQNQDGSPVGSSSPIGLQLSPHSGKSGTPTKTTGPYNSGNPPGPVPMGNGSIPAAFPHYFSFGVMSPPATASSLDDMRTRNGAA